MRAWSTKLTQENDSAVSSIYVVKLFVVGDILTNDIGTNGIILSNVTIQTKATDDTIALKEGYDKFIYRSIWKNI